MQASDRVNINSHFEHLQAKYVSTGHADLTTLLMEKYKLLKKLARHRDLLYARVVDRLKAKVESDQQHHWRITHTENIEKLKEKLQDCENEVQKGKAELADKQHELDAQSHFLALASSQIAKKQVEQRSQHQPDILRTYILRHTSIASELHQRRRFLFRQLSKVFPLKRVPSCNPGGERREAASTRQFWTLCGVHLPVGDDPYSVPKQDLGVSLGYMVQFLDLASHYLSAPVLHSARIMGSTSRIWQRSTYWDAQSFQSEEYPLYLSLHSGTTSGEQGLSERDTSILGFSSCEDTNDSSLDLHTGGTSKLGSSAIQKLEMHVEVQKGIKLLKRSVGCVSAYGFNLLLSSMPANMTTFQAFSELLILLSSKETRLRAIRSSQHQINSLAESTLSTTSTMGRTRPEWEHRADLEANFNMNNSVFCIRTDFDRIDGKLGDAALEGWDMVEHPTLPPPPSHSEDVEHWTRAMFVDAKK